MLLDGKKGLVLNATNAKSIGWAIADAANLHGATVGVGAQNERLMQGVEKLIEGRERFDTFTIDFAEEEQYAPLREAVAAKYGTIDFLVHSAAYAPKEDLQGRTLDVSKAGFLTAMEISAYSFIRLIREMEPVLADDSSIVALSYIGSTRAAQDYNLMGLAKAALESAVRYAAYELGGRGIRVNTLSPGPVNTISGRGVPGLLEKIKYVHERAPLKREYGAAEAGSSAIYLISDLSRGVSGQVVFVDNGYNMIAI